MKLKLYTVIFITLTALLFSCKSAEKMYLKGNYDEAVELAAKKLSKKPNDAGLLQTLQSAYRFALEDHESRIRNFANSFDDLKYERVYQEYLDLQRLYDAVHRSPAVFDIVQPTDYSAYITTYKEQAANARVERGQTLMDNNTKQGAKDAYAEFQRALDLKPGDIPIRQKLDDAYANAVTNVVLLPLTRYGIQYSSYNFDMNNFNTDIMRYLNNNNNNRFVRYYQDAEARSYNLRTDNIVEMRFSDVNIGRYRDQRNTREVSRQIVGKERVYSKDSVVKEYITVKATITTTTRSIQADGLLQATVKDYNNRWLWSDTYRGDYSWQASFSTFTGDERALSDEDRKLIAQKEQWPPSNDEIIRIIMNEIRNKTECGISDYFKRMN
jgi:tetratricopeptide (TPR) repeat protein